MTEVTKVTQINVYSFSVSLLLEFTKFIPWMSNLAIQWTSSESWRRRGKVRKVWERFLLLLFFPTDSYNNGYERSSLCHSEFVLTSWRLITSYNNVPPPPPRTKKHPAASGILINDCFFPSQTIPHIPVLEFVQEDVVGRSGASAGFSYNVDKIFIDKLLSNLKCFILCFQVRKNDQIDERTSPVHV